MILLFITLFSILDNKTLTNNLSLIAFAQKEEYIQHSILYEKEKQDISFYHDRENIIMDQGKKSKLNNTTQFDRPLEKLYTSKTTPQFSIIYPSNWLIREHETGDGIMFQKLKSSDHNNFLTFNITVQPSRLLFPSLSSQVPNVIFFYKQTHKDFHLIEKKQVVLLNNTAFMLYFTYLDDEFGKIGGIDLAMLSNGFIYTLKYRAEFSQFVKYLPIIYNMIKSFYIIYDIYDLYDKGYFYNGKGNYRESIKYFDKVLEIDPNHISALSQKGISLYKLGEYEEAIEYYNKALEIDPNFIEALLNGGVALIKLKKYNEAILYFDKLIKIASNKTDATSSRFVTDALFNKGFALYSLGKNEKAIEYFDQVLDRDPNYVEALNNKGNALNKLEKYNEAMKSYEKALKILKTSKIKPTSSNFFTSFQLIRIADINLDNANGNDFKIYYTNLGISYAKNGEYAKAISYFKLVINDSEYGPAYWNLAESLVKIGNQFAAIKYYDIALELNPQYAGGEISQEPKTVIARGNLSVIAGTTSEEPKTGGGILSVIADRILPKFYPH